MGIKLSDFLKKREEQKRTISGPREICPDCHFSVKTCYCSQVKSFDPKIKFVILIHQLEIERKIATGRLSHLILKNSELIRGHDYTHNIRVNQLISDELNACYILYPGNESVNLSNLDIVQKQRLTEVYKQLVIFVIDGTWATSRQTMRLSHNLKKLPTLSFNQSNNSNFRIRKQPKAQCLSTVEAIYQTIELLAEGVAFDINTREHDNLLHVFDWMVDNQLKHFSQE